MNRTLTSPDIVVSPSHNERSSPLRLSCLEAPTLPDRGDISGQSTRFSTTNMALRAVKEAEEHDESHVDFARHCGKSPLTMSAVLHCVYLAWKHPRRRIEVTFQVSRPRFSTTNTALRAVKEAKEHDESQVDFTRQCGKSPVTTSAVLHCVWQRRRDRGAK